MCHFLFILCPAVKSQHSVIAHFFFLLIQIFSVTEYMFMYKSCHYVKLNLKEKNVLTASTLYFQYKQNNLLISLCYVLEI